MPPYSSEVQNSLVLLDRERGDVKADGMAAARDVSLSCAECERTHQETPPLLPKYSFPRMHRSQIRLIISGPSSFIQYR